MASKRSERRKRVMVGNLPDDFLRIYLKAESSDVQQRNEVASTNLHQPVNNSGTLSVTVVEAKLTRVHGIRKMDPYVRVHIGYNVYETPTNANGSKHPTWNKTFQTYLPHGINTVFFDVYDERFLVADDHIAWGSFTLPKQFFQGDFLNTWINLSGKQGENKEGQLHVIFNFAPTTLQQLYASAPMMVLHSPRNNGLPHYYGYNTVPCVPVVNNQWPVNPAYEQPVEQSVVPLSENDLQQLQDMFPSFDKEVVANVFESCGRNKAQTIDKLLSMGSGH